VSSDFFAALPHGAEGPRAPGSVFAVTRGNAWPRAGLNPASDGSIHARAGTAGRSGRPVTARIPERRPPTPVFLFFFPSAHAPRPAGVPSSIDASRARRAAHATEEHP